MPFVKIYIHFAWSTKNRFPFLGTYELRKQVWQHIKDNGRDKGIFIDVVGGYTDHCHCLVSLGADQHISKIAQLIKGESAHWINKSNLCSTTFEWQDEYFAVSVSESMVERIRAYINKQEGHHKHKSFADEYDEFIKMYGFKRLG